jgi:signal transduction histidine kinase
MNLCYVNEKPDINRLPYFVGNVSDGFLYLAYHLETNMSAQKQPVWKTIIEPLPSVVGWEQRRHARTLAGVAILYGTLNLLIPLFTLLLMPEMPFFRNPLTMIGITNGVILLITFVASRTQWYRAAAISMSLLLVVSSILSVGTVPLFPTVLLPWLLVPVLLASFVLRWWETAVIAFIELTLSLVLIPLLHPDINRVVFMGSLLFIMVMSSMMVLVAFLRRRDEKDLRSEQIQLALTEVALEDAHLMMQARIDSQTAALSSDNEQLRQEIYLQHRIEGELARSNRELSLMFQVVTESSAALNVQDVLTILCRELAASFKVPQAAATLMNEDQSALIVVAEYLGGGGPSAMGDVLPLANNPLTSAVLKEKKAIVINDAQHDPRLNPVLTIVLRRQIKSMIIFPIWVGNQVLGTLGLDATELRIFTEEEVRLAENAVTAVGQILYTAQLFEAKETQQKLAETLRNSAAIMTSTLDLDEALDRILFYVGELLTYDTANIAMVKGDIVQIVRTRGYTDWELEKWVLSLRWRLSETELMKQMHITQEPVLVSDTLADPVWEVDDKNEHIRSHLAAPIMIEGDLIGFIHLDNKKINAYKPADISVLKVFANQAAVAIHNARLHAQVEQYASELEARVAKRTAELAQANEELKHLSQLKDEFVSNISHELRTPITSLKLRQSLLQRQPEKMSKHLSVMERETERLIQIVEDLLNLSRLDQGRVKLKPQQTNLDQFVSSFVLDRILIAEEKSIELIYHAGCEFPEVAVDHALLGQVLSILLTNAVNYSHVGSTISVSTLTSMVNNKEYVGFAICDQGIGIPIAEQPRIFERFYRGTAGHETNTPGTGLGLAIAHEIIERHRGKIKMTSEGIPGKGATFTILLPKSTD